MRPLTKKQDAVARAYVELCNVRQAYEMAGLLPVSDPVALTTSRHTAASRVTIAAVARTRTTTATAAARAWRIENRLALNRQTSVEVFIGAPTTTRKLAAA
jgi:hypothetical protein